MIRTPKTKEPGATAKEDLTRAVAERIFAWQAVRKYSGELIGRKQDKAGRWRKAKVPDYAGDQRFAYAIDDRMKELKMWNRYVKELTKITSAKELPPEWASPEQRCEAALKTSGTRHLRLISRR